MNPKCVQAVRAAAGGRQISESKLQAMDDAISAQMRELARRDPPRWQGLSRDQRMSEAVAAAMQEVQAQAALKEYRATLQVLKMHETHARVENQRTAVDGVTRSQAYAREIQETANYQEAVRNEAITGLRDLLDAAESKDGTGAMRNLAMRIFDVDNPAMTRDIVREVFKNADGHTGNKLAQQGAKAYLDTIEGQRKRFNSGGGNVGKLGYGYLSQAHDFMTVREAGADKWAADILPLIDRKQYVNTDGSIMGDVDVMAMLKAAHETIASDGMNKTEPGQFKGAGARANHGSDHRVLHFRDGDAWMAYMGKYGDGSLYDSMIGHVGKMARDIGLVERYGPNPEQTHRVMLDTVTREDGAGTMANREFGNTPDAYWSLISGKSTTPENRLIARIGSDARNIQTAAKLGGAVLSSTTDIGTIASTLHFNRLPYFAMLRNVGKQITSAEHREFLQAHGVIGDTLVSSLNRWTGDHMTHSLTGRVANATMKLSLMNAWTDGLRSAFSATMMQGFAKKLGKSWGDLDEWDQHLMQRKGITEADWSVISKAQATERDGVQFLTGDAIRAVGDSQLANKWMAFVSDEAQFAVINPDLATRAIATGGGSQAGTVRGEAMRSFTQFKSFPTAMLSRHWRRILETPQGLDGAPTGFGAESSGGAVVNRVATLAGLGLTLGLLGAIVLQNKALVQGKDPYDMTTGKFWGRAFVQGGGAGYLGDLLFKDPTEQRGNTVEQTVGTVLGPVAGAVAGFAGDLGVVNAWEAAKGKDTNAGAEALRWTVSNTPGANLWQTRAMFEHWFLHHAQEMANPGYLSRMQQRAQKDWGQDYYWTPGEATPSRAPDFAGALGR